MNPWYNPVSRSRDDVGDHGGERRVSYANFIGSPSMHNPHGGRSRNASPVKSRSNLVARSSKPLESTPNKSFAHLGIGNRNVSYQNVQNPLSHTRLVLFKSKAKLGGSQTGFQNIDQRTGNSQMSHLALGIGGGDNNRLVRKASSRATFSSSASSGNVIHHISNAGSVDPELESDIEYLQSVTAPFSCLPQSESSSDVSYRPSCASLLSGSGKSKDSSHHEFFSFVSHKPFQSPERPSTARTQTSGYETIPDSYRDRDGTMSTTSDQSRFTNEHFERKVKDVVEPKVLPKQLIPETSNDYATGKLDGSENNATKKSNDLNSTALDTRGDAFQLKSLEADHAQITNTTNKVIPEMGQMIDIQVEPPITPRVPINVLFQRVNNLNTFKPPVSSGNKTVSSKVESKNEILVDIADLPLQTATVIEPVEVQHLGDSHCFDREETNFTPTPPKSASSKASSGEQNIANANPLTETDIENDDKLTEGSTSSIFISGPKWSSFSTINFSDEPLPLSMDVKQKAEEASGDLEHGMQGTYQSIPGGGYQLFKPMDLFEAYKEDYMRMAMDRNESIGEKCRTNLDVVGNHSNQSYYNLSKGEHRTAWGNSGQGKDLYANMFLQGDWSKKTPERKSWLAGRLLESKDSCRFELPMDLRLLEGMTPMEYLTKYAVISRRRRMLYRATFLKFDKNKDGLLTTKEFIKSLKDIHVNTITNEEVARLLATLGIEDQKQFNLLEFISVAAFSERFILLSPERKAYVKRRMHKKCTLEKADFSALDYKLSGISVNPSIRRVLEVL